MTRRDKKGRNGTTQDGTRGQGTRRDGVRRGGDGTKRDGMARNATRKGRARQAKLGPQRQRQQQQHHQPQQPQRSPQPQPAEEKNGPSGLYCLTAVSLIPGIMQYIRYYRQYSRAAFASPERSHILNATRYSPPGFLQDSRQIDIYPYLRIDTRDRKQFF